MKTNAGTRSLQLDIEAGASSDTVLCLDYTTDRAAAPGSLFISLLLSGMIILGK